MHDPARILVIDDIPQNIRVAEAVLRPQGYEVIGAGSGREGLGRAREDQPDLILLDIMMPDMSGFDVCQALRTDAITSIIPIVIVTASLDQEKVRAIESGADDFVTRPFNQHELIARVRSLLRVKAYHDTIQAQAAQLAAWNQTLEAKVAEAVARLKRFERLRRFLSPQVAQLILESGDEAVLESHRREIVVLFADLRGFTAFVEANEPEEVMEVLGEFDAAVGRLVFEHQGTLIRFAGDGVMVVFNDPFPLPEPAMLAARTAIALRDRTGELQAVWHRRGYGLGLGVGIAMGYATLGKIGFEGRFDYDAIGQVVNMAARLCDQAKSGQILLGPRAHAAIEGQVSAEAVGPLELKGFQRPVQVHNLLKQSAAMQESVHG